METDLKKLGADELSGIVNIYPWFAAARRELCLRLVENGEEACRSRVFRESALHIPDRCGFSRMLRNAARSAASDGGGNVRGNVTGNQLSAGESVPVGEAGGLREVQERPAEILPAYHREVRITGGDYFSQSDYENVRDEGDGKLLEAVRAHKSEAENGGKAVDLGFYTETLALIYAEQGYYEQAIKIYSQLILAYPEKSAYFASLIEKLKNI